MPEVINAQTITIYRRYLSDVKNGHHPAYKTKYVLMENDIKMVK